MPDYFGVLEITPGGTLGRIRVLARLTKLHGVWGAAENFHIEDEIGHTKKVFVTFDLRNPELGYTDQMFVKFEPVESNKPVEPGQDRDRLVIIDRRRLEPFGFCIIKESQAAWREEPRRVAGVPPGATVYVDTRQQGKRVLIGPWTVDQTTEGLVLHVPGNRNYVRSYPCEAIDLRSIIRDEGSRDGRECLLEHPPPNIAEPIDLASGRSLATWLLRKLDDSHLKQVMTRLNQDHPGWREELRRAFEDVQDSFEQKLEKAHWLRTEEILQYLDFDYAQIQKLRTNPLLGLTYEQALERYKECIQQEATQQSSHYLEQIEHKKRELAELEETLAERKQDVDRDEARLQSAATHLEASYEKIVQEFTGFQALLGAVGVMPASPALRPASENIVPVSRENTPKDHVTRLQPLPPAVQNCPDFLAHRLLPALTEWLPDMTLSWAELFHHAVQACKWILVPNPAWALAYQEAMGGTATVKLVQVEPTWLSFADAWQGDVAAYWTSACQDPTCLHLLLFEDVNRSLPECWARPWLDVLAGFRETLPVEGHLGWPENLRVFACLSRDQAALPLSQAVAQHWAAVSINRIGNQPASSPLMRAGHVPWHHWQVWGERDSTEEGGTLPLPQDNDERCDYQDFGPLARSLRRDLSCLRLSLRSVNPDRNVRAIARSIRIEWPQDYLQSANHERL